MNTAKQEDKKKIFELVIEYYNKYHKRNDSFNPGDRISYAGRVYDEQEMINLIDSSLDFWLTSGKYTNEFETKFAQYLDVKYSLGFIVSVINAYYWNNKYVFKKTQIGNLKPLIKTFIAYGFTFLLSNFILFLLIEMIKISELVSPIICLIITIPLNFIINKFWAFK